MAIDIIIVGDGGFAREVHFLITEINKARYTDYDGDY